MRGRVLLRCCMLLLAASSAAAAPVPGTQDQQPAIRPDSRGSRMQEVSTQAAAHHHSRKAGPQNLHGVDQLSSRGSPNNAAADVQPQQQQQQQQPAGAVQQGAASSRRLAASQQPQLPVLDSRLLLLPGHDEFDPTAAVYMASAAQHQQDHQQAAQQASFLASSEAEVTAAAPVVVAAVSTGPQLSAAATGHTSAAAGGAPVPPEPTPAPSIRVQQQQQQQQQEEVGDSEAFMSEDDYSLASARAFGVHAVSQAATLSSGWAADGSGPADDEDAFHDNEAEAAATASAGNEGGSTTQPVFEPQVLPAPVPKHPRLYATLRVPPTSSIITGQAARAAAWQVLKAALQSGTSPQGVTSFSGLTGLSLEDKLLLARLLGHHVVGDFDAAGRLDPGSPEYWALLDTQLEASPHIKHMFEPTFYTCHKLLNPSVPLEQLESQGDTHVLSWLGIREAQLPGPGEVADFDELVALLASVGARARLVTDPLPFLTTTTPPLGRDGIPLLIHMTLKHKGRLSRHHLMSLVSWASHNPEASILLYDDNDLEAYISTFDASLLQLYASLETGVERSDLWRYTVLCRHGGVYADVDTLCVKPVQEWNSQHGHDAEVLIGVEDVFRRDPSAGASTGWGVASGLFGVQFLQFTLAGARGHPVFCRMPKLIQQRVDGIDDPSQRPPSVDADDWRILHRTGPHVWTDSVLQLMHNASIGWHEALAPGGRLVGDAVRVLPGTFFGCPAHLISPSREGQQGAAAVLHFFRGGWRKHSNDATTIG